MAGGDSFGDATPNSDGQAEFLSQLTVEEADKIIRATVNSLLHTILQFTRLASAMEN